MVVNIYKYDSCVVYVPMNVGVKKSNAVFNGIYPNPAASSANVSFTKKNMAHNITVMDISGKVIAKYNVAAGVNYGTIMKPAAGTYFVQVTAADGTSAASTLVFE